MQVNPSVRIAAMSTNTKRRAFFLDRDGTLAEEVGSVNHLSWFRLYPGCAEVIGCINGAGYAAVVVTFAIRRFGSETHEPEPR